MAAVRGDPHSPQNFSVPSIAEPQDRQASRSGCPHSVQNFLPAGFSAAQLPQTATFEA
jgi:hypothetical protein